MLTSHDHSCYLCPLHNNVPSRKQSDQYRSLSFSAEVRLQSLFRLKEACHARLRSNVHRRETDGFSSPILKGRRDVYYGCVRRRRTITRTGAAHFCFPYNFLLHLRALHSQRMCRPQSLSWFWSIPDRQCVPLPYSDGLPLNCPSARLGVLLPFRWHFLLQMDILFSIHP